MRQIVRDTFRDWSTGHEGRVPCPYLDIRGFATAAIGLLVDDTRTLTPPESMLALPWRRPDGQLATRAEVAAEWLGVVVLACDATDGGVRVLRAQGNAGATRQGNPLQCRWVGTSRVCLAHRGWLAARQVTRLRLDAEAIDDVTDRTRDRMWSVLTRRFPLLERAPADAQRPALSLAWAMGPEFSGAEWPRLVAALRAGDWATAAQQCRMRERDNPGVAKRNDDNEAHFFAAARVVAEGLDPDRFWAGVPSPQDAPTVPEVPNPPSILPSAEDIARASFGARRAMIGDALGRDDDEG